MKIVLKPNTEDDFRRLARALATGSGTCPEDYRLETECDQGCYDCWKKALTEGAEDEQGNR